jgi:hypothetical protein
VYYIFSFEARSISLYDKRSLGVDLLFPNDYAGPVLALACQLRGPSHTGSKDGTTILAPIHSSLKNGCILQF